MSKVRLGIACFVLGAVAGCGGDGGGGGFESNELCTAIASGSGFVCNNCVNVSDGGNAFDGKLDTAASIGAAGQGGLQGTAAQQPVGSIAGVYFLMPSEGGLTVAFNTFSGGTPQETSGTASQTGVSQSCPMGMTCLTREGGEAFIGFTATKAYDTLRAEINNTGSTSLSIRELCVR